MDLATIDITPEEAAERLKAYEGLIVEKRTTEDEAIASAYRAAARGMPVVSLSKVMALGGWFDDGLPRLAICRADANRCFVRTDSWRAREGECEVTFVADDSLDFGRARVGIRRVNVTMPRIATTGRLRYAGNTIVPLVPPQHRPHRGRLGLFHVLWEVEKWDPTPPRDPALLRHIHGDLWSVMAVWDLTELERAVIAARADT